MSLTYNNGTSVILGILTPQIIFYDSEVKGCMRCDTHTHTHMHVSTQYSTQCFCFILLSASDATKADL